MVVKQVSDLSLREAGRGFLISLKASGRHAESYLDSLERTVALAALFAEEHTWPAVKHITTTHIEEYLAYLQTRPRWFGERETTNPRQLSRGHINGQYRRRHRFFNWLVERDYVGTNPLHLIKPPRLDLRQTTQALKDQGHQHALPQLVQRSLRSIAADDREDTQGTGSLRLRTLRNETVQVTLMQEWRALQRTAEIRRQAAGTVLQHLLSSLPQGARGADLLVETTMGQLTGALNAQPMLGAGIRNIEKLLHQALLWLHDQDVIRLNKGLTILRPAMTIRLEAGRRRFQKSDYTPLQMHYDEQVLQIHIMTEYAHQGLNSMVAALHLALDYFSMSRDGFLDKWLASRFQELQRQTTPESWRKIESEHTIRISGQR